MPRKCFPHYWPFVRGIQWWAVDGTLSVAAGFPSQRVSNDDFVGNLNKLLKQQSSCLVIWDTMTLMWRYWSGKILLPDEPPCHRILVAHGLHWTQVTLVTYQGKIICIIVGTIDKFNSTRPCDAYMRYWLMASLVQIMACRLFGAKPLSKSVMALLLTGDFGIKCKWNFNRDLLSFIQAKEFKNVVFKTTAIFRPEFVKAEKDPPHFRQ